MKKLLWCSLLLLMAAGVQTLKAQSVQVTGVSLSETELTLAVGAKVPLKATVTPANATNQEVTWTSDKPEVASVDANGTVTAVAAGEATVTVKTKDGDKTASCKVTVKKGIELQYKAFFNDYTVSTVDAGGAKAEAKSGSVVKVGTKLLLEPKSGGIHHARVNGQPMTLSADWLSAEYTVKGSEKDGKAEIEAGIQHLYTYNKDEGVEFLDYKGDAVPSPAIVGIGMNFNLRVTAPSGQVIQELKIGEEVEAKAAGKANFYSGTFYVMGLKAPQRPAQRVAITVRYAKPVAVTSVSLSKTKLTLAVGASETLGATVTPAEATNKNVKWSVDDESVATVDENGKVTAMTVGTTTITVTTEDGGKWASCDVTVDERVAVKSVSFEASEQTLLVGGTKTLVPKILPADATNKNLTWKSDDETIAAVDENGKVTAKKVGETTVTVTTEDGGKTASCKVKVVDRIAVTGVSIDKGEVRLKVGEVQVLKAVVKPADAANRNVSWASGNEEIAAVDENGKVTAKAEGQTTITVTTEDGGKTASCEVIVDKVLAVESELLSDASVTPNPATDRIEVSSKERVCAYELFDANGRCVLAGTNSTPRFTIDISSLASGVYYCRLVDSEGRSVVRSVVKR